MFVRVRSESPTGLAGSAYRSAVLALAAYGLLAALRDDTPAVPDVARFPADGKNRTAVLSAQGMPGTWQARECLHVTGSDAREVPEFKRGDPGQPKALGDGRHGGTDDAKRTIKISLHEFGHAADVSALEFGDLEPVTVERPTRANATAWLPLPSVSAQPGGSSHPPVAYRVARLPVPLVRQHWTRNGAGKTVTRSAQR